MIRVRRLTTSILVALACAAPSAARAQFGTDELPLRIPRPSPVSSQAARLRSSAAPPDTIYVGYTPGRFNAATNWWSIGAGRGAGFHRPPAQGGMWDWEPTGGSYLHGDSLQGWWPRRLMFTSTGGQTLPDWRRPWWAVDIGNQVNFVLGSGQDGKRTFGVVGVWHRDNGNVTGAGATWEPLEGGYSAWMGLRRHGDVSFVDPITNNPFNDDCAMFNVLQSSSATGTDKGFPGYGSQWDQMMYRDIDMSADPGADLTLTFRYRTNMSTGVGTASATRTGWFDKDPLQVTDDGGATNAAAGNFISSSDAGNAGAPRDSFMVYVGAPVADGACLLSNGVTRPVFDPMRRWFSEVIRALEPGLHREIHGSAGDAAPTLRSVVVPNSVLAPMLAASGNRVRLVFRVKTNRGFDDEGTGYTSGGAGAAVVDDVGYAFGAHSNPAGWGDFEQPSSIDNALAVSPLDAWKSTGKPPSHYAHPHALADLSYQDLCGDVGDFSRVCNMTGVVLSLGDHDHSEAAGDLTSGTADRERWDGVASPTIQLCGPYPNPIGLASLADAVADQDYYLDYELYTGVFDPFTKGNMWWPGLQSYPSAAKASSGGYATWGNVRYVPFTVFNPEVKCMRDPWTAVKANALMRWSTDLSQSPFVPDSVRLLWIKRQECFRFGISTGCSPTDGAYLDNFSLAIVDAPAPALSVASIWDLFQDTFPANETAGLPATTAAFDTAAAYVKTGSNIAPQTTNRFDVPGDSAVVASGGTQERVDLVFRILPGPGNYVVVGRPDASPGAQLRATPNAATVIAGPVPNSANFWESYLADNGAKGTPGGHAGGLWDPNVWNSARCDTVEISVFAFQGRGVMGGPFDSRSWRTTYHESELGIAPAPEHGDPYPVVSARSALGIARHRCYVASATAPTNQVDCVHDAPGVGAGYDLTYLSGPGSGWNGTNTTVEGTKILPDGQFTAGTHVQYFFRGETDGGTFAGLMPDTNVVFPQLDEANEDGHRWQQFGVLPDRWKDIAHRHPVTGTFGAGNACLLVVDAADRRGDELAWVGVADTIGLTQADRFGAHNGWHARGDQSVNDPTGFVRPHLGQPGTVWDLYQVKAGETLGAAAGSIGSRLAFRDATNTQINGKSARLGPTPEMLERFYRGIVYLSGDLTGPGLGPLDFYRTQDDVKLLTDWLAAGDVGEADRFFWAIGGGFVESNDAEGTGSPQDDFNQLVLGVDLRSPGYAEESGNTEAVPDLLPSAGGPLAIYGDEWGVRNICTWTNDVLVRSPALFSETVTASEYEPYGPGPFPLDHTVVKQHTAAHPWIAAVTGSRLPHITSRFGNDTRGRYRFVQEMLMGPLAIGFCPTAGFPPLDVPGRDVTARDYVRFANNPVRSGNARIEFGLPVEDRVAARIFDVAGRGIRTLAERTFPAGEHTLVWDGTDDAGARVARGVYFVRIARAGAGPEVASKIVVLQ